MIRRGQGKVDVKRVVRTRDALRTVARYPRAGE